VLDDLLEPHPPRRAIANVMRIAETFTRRDLRPLHRSSRTTSPP
jgi:hypothetical protein